MDQKPKAYVKTKYQNYYHNNKTTTKSTTTQILSTEYQNYIKLQNYLKTHKKIKKEVKNKIQKQINTFKHNKNLNILNLLHTKYNNYNFDYLFK